MSPLRRWLHNNYALVYFAAVGALVLLGWWLWN